MIHTRDASWSASVLACSKPRVAIAQQSEGHPTVMVRKSAPEGAIIAKIPNGTLISLLGGSVGNYVRISVEKDHDKIDGWVKKSNLRPTTDDIDAECAQKTWTCYVCLESNEGEERRWCNKCRQAKPVVMDTPPAAPAETVHPALAGPPLQIDELPEDFINMTTRQVDKDDFQSPHPGFTTSDGKESILSYLLQTNCICLLSGRWLVEQFHRGVRFLPRRQEMPAAAYCNVSDLLKSDFKSRTDKVMLLALSYGWIQRGHPDRDSWHLSQVVNFLVHQFWMGSVCLSDVALFWDFYSLEQLPRTATEDLRFKTALRFMNVVYGHCNFHILRLNDLPPGINPTCERGWPFFEEAVFSTAQKNGSTYVCSDRNLLASPVHLGHHRHSETMELMQRLQVGRNVPMSPRCFQRQLMDKKFTGKGDKEAVEKMYLDNFAIMTLGDSLSLKTFWNVAKAHQLAKALYHYQKLRSLYIEGPGFDDDCCAELLKHAGLSKEKCGPDCDLHFRWICASSEAVQAVEDAAQCRQCKPLAVLDGAHKPCQRESEGKEDAARNLTRMCGASHKPCQRESERKEDAVQRNRHGRR